MNHVDIESWAARAAAELQAVLNSTLEAAGLDEPEPGREANNLLGLLDEYDDIRHGRPTWQTRATATQSELPPGLMALGT